MNLFAAARRRPRSNDNGSSSGYGSEEVVAAPHGQGSPTLVDGLNEALAAAEVAEAEAAAAEAHAAAASARARATRLRRQAELIAQRAGEGTARQPPDTGNGVSEASEEKTDVHDVARGADGLPNIEVADAEKVTGTGEGSGGTEEAAVAGASSTSTSSSPRRWRPRLRWRPIVATTMIVLSIALLGASGYMIALDRRISQQRQRSAEFAAAARQGVVSLMSLDFTHAKDDVQRIIDNSTGDFKKNFQATADDFAKGAQDAKAVSNATVNATAVESMSDNSAVVLVAVKTTVTNISGANNEPRSWRLSVTVARDGGQLKIAKVDFVP